MLGRNGEVTESVTRTVVASVSFLADAEATITDRDVDDHYATGRVVTHRDGLLDQAITAVRPEADMNRYAVARRRNGGARLPHMIVFEPVG